MTVLPSASFSVFVSISNSIHVRSSLRDTLSIPQKNLCSSFCIQQSFCQKKYCTLLNTLNNHISPVCHIGISTWWSSRNPLQMYLFPVFHYFLPILQQILFVNKSSSCCTTFICHNLSFLQYLCHPLDLFVFYSHFNKTIRLSQY